MILIDSGPLVAMFDKRDEYHGWIIGQLVLLKPPFHTCEAVVSETCFLLSRNHFDTRYLFQLFQRKVLLSSFVLQDEYSAIGSLMKKYSGVPMALADACLVRLAEKHSQASVLTLDGDFLIYRKANRQAIPLIIPDEIRLSIRHKGKSRH